MPTPNKNGNSAERFDNQRRGRRVGETVAERAELVGWGYSGCHQWCGGAGGAILESANINSQFFLSLWKLLNVIGHMEGPTGVRTQEWLSWA